MATRRPRGIPHVASRLKPMLLARSLIFQVWLYGLMLVLGLLFLPLAIWSRGGAYYAISVFLRLVFWGLRVFCGLTAETRGPLPTGDVLVAAKHQSFLDILILCRDLPEAKFVMKRSLVWTPVLGFYALRIGAATVDRGRGRAGADEMMAEIARRSAFRGQLVIFPQGTRLAPGADAPYKIGAHPIYRAYGLPCVPAALNTGHFWRRRRLIIRPGRAVVRFLEPLPAGLPEGEFMAALEQTIEPASAALSAEAERRRG